MRYELTSYSLVKKENLPRKIRNKTRMATLTTAIQNSTGTLAREISYEKETKASKLKKKQNYLFCRCDFIYKKC